MALEHIRHWKVGDVTVHRIVEVANFADDIAVLLQGADAKWLQQFTWLAPHFITPEGKMIIAFQAFVVQTPTRRIMVDACIGNDRQTRFAVFSNLKTSFLADIASVGCPADSIDTVLCTHLHYDHVGWATHLVNGRWEPTFRNARHLFARKEFESTKKLRAAGDVHASHYDDTIAPILAAGLVDLVETDYRLSDEIWFEPTHGHTAGHVSVRIRSQGEEAVITGDLMHHPVQCTVPDQIGNFDEDQPLACRTRREFLQRVEGRRALVIGSHFADPSAGWVERNGDTWRFLTQED